MAMDTTSGDRRPAQQRSSTFFLRGLKTLLPTLITLYLVVWAWDFLWEQVGRHLIWLIQNLQFQLAGPTAQWGAIRRFWTNDRGDWQWWAQLFGVSLAVLMVYVVGLLVGNLIGRTFWKLAESGVMKLPIVRAIYPAVKQVTDFVLQERSALQGGRVVACRPHANDIWSIGLVTGPGLKTLSDLVGDELVSVFIPSSPTAFSGYVLMVPRSQIVELPLKVEEAMRLLISGGVVTPGKVPGATKSLSAGSEDVGKTEG